MTINPFEASKSEEIHRGVFSDHAVLTAKSFLYRRISVQSPFTGDLLYTGWWFRQLVAVDGQVCWFQISWLNIRPRFEIDLPESVAIDPAWSGRDHPQPRRLRFEIDFSRGLRIRRLRIWLAGRMLYDEIN